METIGDYLRLLRERNGVSLSRLADRAGLSRRTLSYWEARTYQPRLPELESLLTALKATEAERQQAVALLNAARGSRQVRLAENHAHLEGQFGPQPAGADLLRALRFRRGLSSEQAAAQAGISLATLSRWETGRVVPEMDDLDRLFPVLGADEAECRALTASSLFQHTSAFPASSPERLQAEFEQFRSGLYHRMEDRLNELQFVAFEARAWQLGRRDPAARRLLAELYARHAVYLAAFRRVRETATLAARAFDLLEAADRSEAYALQAALVLAQASVYGRSRPKPKEGVEMLGWWQEQAVQPAYRAWIMADRAEYMALAGGIDAAVRLAIEACRVAESAHPSELRSRQRDLAKLYLRAGRAEEAIALAEIASDDPPFWRVSYQLVRAEGLGLLHDRAGAAQELAAAYSDIDAYALENLRERADILAERFRSGRQAGR